MKQRSALLVGATGLIGRDCLTQLLNCPAYQQVIVLTRRDLLIKHAKLQQHLIDFNHLSANPQLFKAQDIYCCLGSTMKKAGSKEAFYQVDFTYTYEIAREAAAQGGENFLLVSSIGADAKSSNFYLRVKGEIEAAIAKLPFKSIQIFQPSFLLGEREETRSIEQLGMALSKGLSFLMVANLKKYRPITGHAVAKAMIECAQKDLTGLHIYQSDQIQQIYEKAGS